MTSPYDSALNLAFHRGWAVFPVDHPDNPHCVGVKTLEHDPHTCVDRGKHPAVAFSREATTDATTIHMWWTGTPRNVGINAGKSGLLIIDEDKPDGLDKYARANGLLIPATFTVKTAKGRHYYFQDTEEGALGNAEGALRDYGINVRSGNAYVVGPGSTHASGEIYTIVDDSAVATLPVWLVEAIRYKPQAKTDNGTYERFALPDVIRDGQRDDTLFRYASSLLARDSYSPSELQVLMQAAWRRCEQPPAAITPYTLEQAIAKLERYEPGRSEGYQKNGNGTSPPLGEASPEQTQIDARQLQIESLYVTHEGLADIRPPEALIEGWLYRNSLAWLSGKPGDGKSFIALDMAYSVATGTDWQGYPTQQGTVLYVAAEGASGLSIRANAWVKAHAHGDPGNPPVVYLPLAVNLTAPSETDVQALAQALVALRPVLVIIDTQARVTTGAEENSSKDMGVFVDALETLRAANPATYLTVHHTPRNGDNLRGSTALEGAADTVLRSVKDGEVITLECKKQKNAAEAEDFQLYMQPIGDSIVLSHEAVGLDHGMGPSQKQLLKIMWDLYGTDEVGSTQLREVSDMAKNTYYRALSHLVRQGKVKERKQGNRVWYQATQTEMVPRSQDGPTGATGPGDVDSPMVPPPFKGGTIGTIPGTTLDGPKEKS